MRKPEEKLAIKILMRDGIWGMTGCLAEAKATVALRGYDVLDDLTQLHIRLLALICSGLKCTESNVNIYFSSDLKTMASELDDLLENGFVRWVDPEYIASDVGMNVIHQIGVEMLELDRFRMTGDIQESEMLLGQLRK